MKKNYRGYVLSLLLLLPSMIMAAVPEVAATVRYMSLGDSLAAGYKALPATEGYAYQLYLGQVFGSTSETVFANAAVPGATSSDVLHFQLPQVPRFSPTVVTMSIGGNDLLGLLGETPPTPEQVFAVLSQFANNMTQILAGLCAVMPEGGDIYLHNLYAVPGIPETEMVVPFFNDALSQVVMGVSQLPVCHDNAIAVADVFSAFHGQDGLLLIERYEQKGLQNTFEVHLTNKGHRLIEAALRELGNN